MKCGFMELWLALVFPGISSTHGSVLQSGCCLSGPFAPARLPIAPSLRFSHLPHGNVNSNFPMRQLEGEQGTRCKGLRVAAVTERHTPCRSFIRKLGGCVAPSR